MNANTTGASNTGYTPYERLTPTQVDAMAETLWDFTWNSDPNDVGFYEQKWRDAPPAAQRHYREWARAIFLAAQEGKPVHAWITPEVREDSDAA